MLPLGYAGYPLTATAVLTARIEVSEVLRLLAWHLFCAVHHICCACGVVVNTCLDLKNYIPDSTVHEHNLSHIFQRIRTWVESGVHHT